VQHARLAQPHLLGERLGRDRHRALGRQRVGEEIDALVRADPREARALLRRLAPAELDPGAALQGGPDAGAREDVAHRAATARPGGRGGGSSAPGWPPAGTVARAIDGSAGRTGTGTSGNAAMPRRPDFTAPAWQSTRAPRNAVRPASSICERRRPSTRLLMRA